MASSSRDRTRSTTKVFAKGPNSRRKHRGHSPLARTRRGRGTFFGPHLLSPRRGYPGSRARAASVPGTQAPARLRTGLRAHYQPDRRQLGGEARSTATVAPPRAARLEKRLPTEVLAASSYGPLAGRSLEGATWGIPFGLLGISQAAQRPSRSASCGACGSRLRL